MATAQRLNKVSRTSTDERDMVPWSTSSTCSLGKPYTTSARACCRTAVRSLERCRRRCAQRTEFPRKDARVLCRARGPLQPPPPENKMSLTRGPVQRVWMWHDSIYWSHSGLGDMTHQRPPTEHESGDARQFASAREAQFLYSQFLVPPSSRLHLHSNQQNSHHHQGQRVNFLPQCISTNDVCSSRITRSFLLHTLRISLGMQCRNIDG